MILLDFLKLCNLVLEFFGRLPWILLAPSDWQKAFFGRMSKNLRDKHAQIIVKIWYNLSWWWTVSFVNKPSIVWANFWRCIFENESRNPLLRHVALREISEFLLYIVVFRFLAKNKTIVFDVSHIVNRHLLMKRYFLLLLYSLTLFTFGLLSLLCSRFLGRWLALNLCIRCICCARFSLRSTLLLFFFLDCTSGDIYYVLSWMRNQMWSDIIR